jgi:PHP family Zn ribbon phosphoesterase
MSAQQPGARFVASDLHVHTPASHDYADKSASAKDIVDAAIASKLHVIAVTDHNSADWVDVVRQAAKKTGLAVLPGVEVSTPHCHILALFDVATPKARIDDFLTRVGITTPDRGKKEVNSQSIEEVLPEIDAAGGLAIAAHANSSNGMLQQGSGQFKIKLCKDPRVAALEFTQQPHVDGFRQGKISGYPAKASVQGSDSHSLSTIGDAERLSRWTLHPCGGYARRSSTTKFASATPGMQLRALTLMCLASKRIRDSSLAPSLGFIPH